MLTALLGAAGRQHGLVGGADIARAGLDAPQVRALVRRGAWVQVRRGVYADAEVWAAADDYTGRPLLRVRAAHLVLEEPHVFSHASAALLHGVPLISTRDLDVHITRPGVTGNRLTAGINHHTAPYAAARAVVVDGLPTLDLPRTCADLARQGDLLQGVAACDWARARGTSDQDLRDVAATMWSWPGVRTVRRAIDLADPGAESILESCARVRVESLGLGRPDTQFGLTDGSRTVFCDFRIGRHMFEADGRVKLLRPEDGGVADDPREALWREKRRQDFVTGFGLGVSRITFQDCFGGWEQAQRRLLREYAATVARFGTDISDLAPYVVRRGPRVA